MNKFTVSDVDVLAKLRERFDRDFVCEYLSHIGFEVNRSYKFRLREDERTPSASISPKGYIKDFGSEWGGDLIQLLIDYRSMSFKNAVEILSNYIGIESCQYEYENKPVQVNNTSLDQQSIESQFNSFQTTSIEQHAVELHKVCPPWLYKEANQHSLKLFKYIIRYDIKNHTLIVGCYAGNIYDFSMISYKRRRFITRDGSSIKWMAQKGTHPNKSVMYRILPTDAPLFVIEGHHDALTAILLGINFIMLPTASFRPELFPYKAIQNRHLIFIVEDKAALKCMLPIAQQASEYASHIVMKQFDHNTKCDLSDLVFRCSSKTEVFNAMQY